MYEWLTLAHVCACCMCATCMLSAQAGQKRALDPLKLELLIAVRSRVGAGNRTWALHKSRKCS